MGAHGPRNLTLDAGGLIAFDRGDPRVRAILRQALEAGVDIAVPAGALAQAWRNGSTQARLAVLITDQRIRTEALTEVRACAAGVLCGRTGSWDVVDASVVLCARGQGNSLVLTSDRKDLAALDPRLNVISV